MDEIKNQDNINKINKSKNSAKLPKVKYTRLNPIIRRGNQNINKINKENMKTDINDNNNNEKIPFNINSSSNNNKTKDFNLYTENLEKSMHKYQMSYFKDNDDEENNNEIDINLNKYINKEDKALFKKVHDLNNSFENANKYLTSKNSKIKIEVPINYLKYPNPIKSLGIIRNNYYIYNELNKGILTRQSESFNKQIDEMNHITAKYAKKMPKIHITDVLLKEPANIPLANLNKKKKSLNLNLLEKNKKNLKLFSYYKYPLKNFPEGREQFSICRENNYIIISGGICINMKYLAIWRLNINILEWEKINIENKVDNRYGHTALCLGNKLYIYGGKTKYLNTNYMNGLDIFSFQEKRFINFNIYGEKPENRKNHISLFLGVQMFIHGGINEEGKILDDSFLFNIHTLTWSKCNISKMCFFPKLYGHACSAVLPGNILYNPKFSIYSYPELDTVKTKNIKKKGLYVFGGKCEGEFSLSNKLYILLMGRKPLEWIKVETKGKPPIPRYAHSMNFYERGNYVIIHGGRNDTCVDNSSLNDTFLLNLENLEWIEVTLFSNINNFNVAHRCSHQSIIYSDKLIIFGGMNNNNFLGSSLFVINLDFSYRNDFKTNIERQLIELNDKNNKSNSNYDDKEVSKIKQNLKIKEIGVINNVTLPKIK